MRYTERQDGDITIVAIEGDIDLECSGEVRDILLGCVLRQPAVVVDMAGVGLIDSSGVASLLEGFQNARKRGKAFVLSGVGDTVLRVLRLARLDTVFILTSSVDEAVAAARS